MAVINPPGYLHNLATHTAQTDRLADTALLLPDAVGSLRPKGGIRIASDLQVTALGTPNMSVNLSAGSCWVPQGQSNLGGAYNVNNDGTFNMTIAAANASLSRNDLVVARVRDQFYTGTQNIASFEVITGTAASSPTDPVLPTDSSFLTLARVVVPAGATSIGNSNITNLAAVAPVLGGINPVSSTDATSGLFIGQERDHPTLGQQRWNGTVWASRGAATGLQRVGWSSNTRAAVNNYDLNTITVNPGIGPYLMVIRCSGVFTVPSGANGNLRVFTSLDGTNFICEDDLWPTKQAAQCLKFFDVTSGYASPITVRANLEVLNGSITTYTDSRHSWLELFVLPLI